MHHNCEPPQRNNLFIPLLQDEKHGSHFRLKCIWIACVLVALYFLQRTTSKVSEISVGPGQTHLWNLLKRVQVRDLKGIPRSWPEYYCRTSRNVVKEPEQPLVCKGDMHPCALASLLFTQFRALYKPNEDIGEFPHTLFHLDSKFEGVENHRNEFVNNVVGHMREATEKRHHMIWLVEVFPNHAFILEQGSPTPGSFRLYQSWIKGFDISYWLSESRSDVPCYVNNWGVFNEFKYEREEDPEKAKQHDLEVLNKARNEYGSHQTFDDKTFEEIFTKLSYGWKLLEGSRLGILKKMEKWETSALDITGENKPMWSLKHIFGLEPINLMMLEKYHRKKFFGITVHTLNLGTSHEFEQIEADPTVLKLMEKVPTLENLHLAPVGPPLPPDNPLLPLLPSTELRAEAIKKDDPSLVSKSAKSFLPEVPIIPRDDPERKN